MSYANCSSCGKEVYWRAQRGVRLADLRCGCGGALLGKTAGQASKTKGKTYRTCAMCGRRRLHLVAIPDERRAVFQKQVLPAGSLVCPWHSLEISEAESSRLFPGWDGNPYAFTEARLLAKLAPIAPTQEGETDEQR